MIDCLIFNTNARSDEDEDDDGIENEKTYVKSEFKKSFAKKNKNKESSEDSEFDIYKNYDDGSSNNDLN